MTGANKKTVLIAGADEALIPGLVREFQAQGFDIHNLRLPFTIPNLGSGIASISEEERLSKKVEQTCVAIGSIDILINCISISPQKDPSAIGSFSAVYATVIRQLGRVVQSVLPGMIIRQTGQTITLVTGDRNPINKVAYHAAITAAVSLADRMERAVKADNIQCKVVFHRSSLDHIQKIKLIDKLVELATRQNIQNSNLQLFRKCLRQLSEITDEAIAATVH
ncbi:MULTISPECIES: SDR family NAD(P)-dependent oxidoreductase [unclassified Phyllobacterium]|uniref:SDR family NAD(P)-dependent oxidoreductase n=1 Tax=unclassified Phyllobacterium TaxID=2638441 RepID=UPI003012E7CE